MCAMLAGCSQQGTLDEIAAMTADTEVTTAVTANAVTTEPVITTAATTTAEKTTATEKVTTTEEVTTAPVTTTTAPAPVTTTNTPAPAPAVTTTTTAVVTTTTTPAPEVVPMGGDIEALLNGAKLNPMKTGDENVDRAVDEILAKVTTSGMSTYQKVKAVYDYIINTYTYETVGYGEGYTSEVYFRGMLDNVICSQAYSLVKTGHGVCYNYASLFMVLTRRIGLESYYVSGDVSTKSGGKTHHYWVLVNINGKYYTFDSQVEQNNLDNGRITYRYFGRLESDMANTYEYNAGGAFALYAMYYVGEDQTFDNARDYMIALFGNFDILDGECPYADWL